MSTNNTTNDSIRSAFRMALAHIRGSGGYIHPNEERTLGTFIKEITEHVPNTTSERTNYIALKTMEEWNKLKLTTNPITKTHLLRTIQLAYAQSALLCKNCGGGPTPEVGPPHHPQHHPRQTPAKPQPDRRSGPRTVIQ
eukprot:1988818-Rhodomonas_salina.1